MCHTNNSKKPLYYGRLIDDAIVVQEGVTNSWLDFLQQMQTFKDNDNNGSKWELLSPPPPKTKSFSLI